MADHPTRTARCDCGSLTLHVAGDPVHVHACTCTECQRTTGSVMSWSAWFPESAVRIEGPHTKHHHRPGQPDRWRGFCPACGTGHFVSSSAGSPGTIAIRAGAFADPGFPPPEFILYWANRPPWLGVPESITLHPESD